MYDATSIHAPGTNSFFSDIPSSEIPSLSVDGLNWQVTILTILKRKKTGLDAWHLITCQDLCQQIVTTLVTAPFRYSDLGLSLRSSNICVLCVLFIELLFKNKLKTAVL